MKPKRTTHATTSAALVTFAAGQTAADTDARTITGLVVPFGPAGHTNDGLLNFSPGSITWPADVGRVKLLRQHDQSGPVLGRATELREESNGVWGTFSIATGTAGDAALAEVAEGTRDGLSIGIALDGATHGRLRRAQAGQVVAASGVLREVSQVSVPAFDDSRAAVPALAAANANLTTFDATHTADTAPISQTGAGTAAAGAPAPAAGVGGETTASEAPAPAPAAAPAIVRAGGAGALTVGAEASTYTLDGRGHSFVRDVFVANVDHDPEARSRLHRFNAELAGGNLGSVLAFVRASGALTTAAPGDPIASPADRADVSIPGSFLPQLYRNDLMITAVDAGRPIVSRLNKVTITSAAPFLIPLEGDFTGVADHTEGTAHAAEGTLTLNDAPVTPRAKSGAYRVTRELVDASNPAIDQIVLRAMLRDYRRVSEQVAVDALVAADTGVDFGIDTAMELRGALVGAVNDDDEPMDFVAASRGMVAALFADVDTSGRPMLAAGSTLPSAVSGPRAGYTGLAVDGTEVVRSSRVPTDRAFLIRKAGVLFAESNVQQFRFDQIEGPGIIKLALWAYVAAAVLRAEDVMVIANSAT